MEVLTSLSDILDKNLKIAITIGNFDGVHLGHQNLISHVMKESKSKGEVLVVCTFVPHPKFILSPAQNFLINSYEERRELMEDLGVKYLLELNFNRDFSTLTPQEFLDKYININSSVSSLYLGHDFAFGANKSGDHDFVKKYCSTRNIECFLEKEFTLNNLNKASSTSIRKCISSGDISQANKLLGRNFFVRGRIIKGQGRGKTIGFPTANIIFSKDRIIPRLGVYASRCHYNGMIYNSITNIGHNPTFNEHLIVNFETHIFDFDNDIYGEEISVELNQFMREEKKFENVNELIKQINLDIEQAKKND